MRRIRVWSAAGLLSAACALAARADGLPDYFAAGRAGLEEFRARWARRVAVEKTALAASAEEPCPALDTLVPEWREHAGPAPDAIFAAHHARALGSAAPMLVGTHAGAFWIGVARRSDALARAEREPGCFVLGSAAFYAVGFEDDPQLDFVATVGRGDELGLADRLIELRWYDPAGGKRQRWFNAPLARRLGWLSDGRGTEDPGARPIPLAEALNALY